MDNNQNKVFDAGDQGYAKLAQIRETVTGKTTTSNGEGYYTISGLYEGTHQVRITVPYGLTNTTPTSVVVPVNGVEVVNFGLYQTL